MTEEEIAQREAAAAAAANAAVNGQENDPLNGIQSIFDKFSTVLSVYRLIKKLAFVLLVLYVVSSLKGYRLKYVDGWSLAVVEKFNPSDSTASLLASPHYLFPENIAMYATNGNKKETLITASLIQTVKKSDGAFLYIIAPVGDHTHTYSVTQREFMSHYLYGFVKVKMTPLVSFFVFQGITSLIKFLLLS